jgi:hypothetical protein
MVQSGVWAVSVAYCKPGPAKSRIFATKSAAGVVTATLLLATVCGQATSPALAANCKPAHPKPIIILREPGPYGACGFDLGTMSFRGEPLEQAKCLMRGMDASRNLSPPAADLPPALASRIGRDGGLPVREVLSGYLSKQDLEWDFAANLWKPLSHARDNDDDAPTARYLVIHDTSGPNFGRRAFPPDIDDTSRINSLDNFKCDDGWGKAHVVVNRAGAMLLEHEFDTPWRETKFERARNFDGALKGLFLHVELIQPRRSAGRWGRNDAETPTPSFTAAQYERLALIYTIASVRAGHWLIPVFHAALDAGIRDGHDDPLHFDVDSFADALDRLVFRLQGDEQKQAAHQ